MRAVTWQGKRKISVERVPDPRIEEPTDAIIRITSTGLCGSDLHLYEVLTPFMTPGDILGHEPMGIVEEVGAGVPDLMAGGGDRPVPDRLRQLLDVPQRAAHPVRDHPGPRRGHGRRPVRLHPPLRRGPRRPGGVPAGPAGPVGAAETPPEGPPDDRFVYLSDVLPTAWQAVAYADIPVGGSVAVLGLGPIGDMACRVAQVRGAGRVFGVDLVPERLERARARAAWRRTT
ncbi:S-(Hydroxymethyl)glutathione dehydrogenase OS=Streptomyces glaucescens OX=1907 GN=fdh2 PE=3 SV=1 [Streptomyces glaucescens]